MPEDSTDPKSQNELAGSAGEVVQAGSISGGVHFHGSVHISNASLRQLPADIRGFVNRTADLEHLDVILVGDSPKSQATIACVVTGTAGVGKTSFVLHWAHKVAGDFPDGQLYVNLRGYDPGSPVKAHDALEHFLRAMGVPAQSIPLDLESRAALYRSLLAGRRMLIVLDNAATVNQTRPLLPGAAGCLALITSRSRLSGLVARDGAYRMTLELLPEQEAIELLRSVTAGYRSLDDLSQLEELARLCARLPLALRIAAERAISHPQTPMHDLIEDLRDESGLWDALTAGDDDESDAVRTVFAWSYRALSQEASQLFRLLGLHPGPDFSSAAASELIQLPINRTRRLLDDLVGAHLLEQVQHDRYQFHDLLRLYATDKARSEEPIEKYRSGIRRIITWYLRTVNAAAIKLAPEAGGYNFMNDDEHSTHPTFKDHASASSWFEQEKSNLCAAVQVAEETKMYDLAWHLAASLYPIYANTNRFDDWIETSSIALGATRQLNDRRGEAIILQSLGKANTQSGFRKEGVKFQEAARATFREIGDRIGEVTSTNAIGLAHLRSRRLTDAISFFETTREIADEVGDNYWLAISLNNEANALLELDLFDDAITRLRRALEIYEHLDLKGYTGDAMRGLSHAYRALGRPQESLELIEEALRISSDFENFAWEGYWRIELGRVQFALGNFGDALIAYQRAATLQRRLGDREREAAAFDATGELYQKLARPKEAADFHRLAVAAFRDLDNRWQLAVALDNLAGTLNDIGEPNKAEAYWKEALKNLSGFTDPRSLGLQARIRSNLSLP
ncbi:tetratricopeptide repeat protein [Amycolatopsis japonica]|uniref:ATP-binding protein n=1 Tax=Amycolatopsis japonica TaxID=208439 RepID=UPI00332B45AC